MTRKETKKEFSRLYKELGFKVIGPEDVEGWCNPEAWRGWLNEMAGLTNGEVKFKVSDLSKGNEVSILVEINNTVTMEIKKPDDNVELKIFDELNELIASLGISKKFRLVFPEGVIFHSDSVFMTYINDEDYAKIAFIGCAEESEYEDINWEDGTFVIKNART